MVSENVSSNESIGSYLAFPAVTTGFGALTSIKRNKGIGNAIKEVGKLRDKGETYNELLKQTHKDVFTRSIAVADNYETYKNAVKSADKLAKKAQKVEEKNSIGLIDKIKNVFSKKKITIKSIKDNSEAAQKTLESIEEELGIDVAKKAAEEAAEKGTKEVIEIGTKEAAKDTAKAALQTGESVAKTAAKTGFLSTTKKLFLKEVTSVWSIGLTAFAALPDFFANVVPAFKEKGTKEGLKETGKWGLKVGADLFSFAAGGAVGRTIGACIGNFICPFVGAGVGGAIGSMIGSMFLGSKAAKAVDKITGEDKKEQNEAIEQNVTQNKNANLQLNA